MKTDLTGKPGTPINRDTCRNYLDNLIFGPSDMKDPEETGLVGIELEVFSYRFDKNEKVIPVPFEGSDLSLKPVLLEVCKDKKGVSLYEDVPTEERSILKKIEFPNGDNFQFEPGGQIEIIINPCKSLLELESRLNFKKSILKGITKEFGIHFIQHGTNPFFDTEEVGLQIPKIRYLHLQDYLDKISTYGRKMMRLTGSLQINLDHGIEEETRIKRIIAANLLSPVATAIFSNSSITSGEKNGLNSYRSYIWQNLDPQRTGIICPEFNSDLPMRKKIVEDYLKFSLQAPIVQNEKISTESIPSNFSFNDWLLDKDLPAPELNDYITHLSLLFPEVRLRKYLELRSVDAPPESWDMLPVYFYTGLLYDDIHLNRLISLLTPLKNEIDHFWKESVHGLKNDKIFELAQSIMGLAIEGFKALPSSFRNDDQLEKLITFNKQFTSLRRSFADEAIENFEI